MNASSNIDTQRQPASGAVVAVTGAAGYLGSAVVRMLEKDSRVRSIVGLDIREPSVKCSKLTFHTCDVTSSEVQAIFSNAGVTHVIHLAFVLDAVRDERLASHIDIDGTKNVLAAGAGAGAKAMVVASSSVVFGAHADNPAFIPEDHVRRPDKGLRYGNDKVTVENLCGDFQKAHPEIKIAVLRPVTIIGADMRNFISRGFLKPVLAVPTGKNPPWQFIHETDCARAFYEAVFSEASGFFNLGADGTLAFSDMARRLGRKKIELPAFLMKTIAQTAWRLGLAKISETPGVLVNYFCWPPVLDNNKFKKELGFRYEYTSEQAFDAFARANERTAPAAERI